MVNFVDRFVEIEFNVKDEWMNFISGNFDTIEWMIFILFEVCEFELDRSFGYYVGL